MPKLEYAHLKAGSRPALSRGVAREMYECCKCGRVCTFAEISDMTKEEYKLADGRTRATMFRCPRCDGRIFEKVQSGVRTVGAK